MQTRHLGLFMGVSRAGKTGARREQNEQRLETNPTDMKQREKVDLRKLKTTLRSLFNIPQSSGRRLRTIRDPETLLKPSAACCVLLCWTLREALRGGAKTEAGRDLNDITKGSIFGFVQHEGSVLERLVRAGV